jgi:hypothetical protein
MCQDISILGISNSGQMEYIFQDSLKNKANPRLHRGAPDGTRRGVIVLVPVQPLGQSSALFDLR